MAEQKQKTCKKRLSTKEEKARQALRTDMNKLRRKKAREKFWAKRRARTAMDPWRKGQSVVKNMRLREEAEAHTIRRIQTVSGNVEVVRRPSIGLLKQRTGVPTKWRCPEGWQPSPIAKEAQS